jgi:hypothetical protein
MNVSDNIALLRKAFKKLSKSPYLPNADIEKKLLLSILMKA